jgi:hypothetical protein
MIRTVIGIILLIATVLWLPIWAQLTLFAAAVVVLPYRLYVLIPAVISDALYAPTTRLSLSAHWLTLIVLTMLGVHWYVIKKMRVQSIYGLEA